MQPTTLAFRRSGTRWAQVILASVAPGFVFLSGMVVSSTHGWEKIACGVALLAFVVLGIRIARLGIFALPDELVVRNYFCSYRIQWGDISRFEMPRNYGAVRKAGLRIYLIDGRLISASLYTRGQIDSGRSARAVLGQLQQLRNEKVSDVGAARQSPTN